MSVLELKKQFSEIPELKFWRAKGRSLEEQDNSRGVNVKNVFFLYFMGREGCFREVRWVDGKMEN